MLDEDVDVMEIRRGQSYPLADKIWFIPASGIITFVSYIHIQQIHGPVIAFPAFGDPMISVSEAYQVTETDMDSGQSRYGIISFTSHMQGRNFLKGHELWTE